MKYLAITMFLLLSVNAYAQSVGDSLLQGSWKLHSVSRLGEADSINGSKLREQYSFNADRSYTYMYAADLVLHDGRVVDTMLLESGRWKRRKSGLALYDRRPVPFRKHFEKSPSFENQELGMSRLLAQQLDLLNNDIFYHFRKGAPLIVDTSRIRQRDLILVNVQDPDERKRINIFSNITLQLGQQDSAIDKHSLEGQLMDVRDSVVIVKMIHEDITRSVRNGGNERTEIRYYSEGQLLVVPNRYQLRSVPLKSISSITVPTKKGNDDLAVFSGSMMVIGAITSLVVAPLASINYSRWSFNANRYFWMAGSGLALVTVNIPIAIISGASNKFYQLKGSANGTFENWHLATTSAE